MTPPAVPDPFYWTPSPCGVVLKCRPLEAIAPHLFTTRELPLSSSADWRRLGDALNAKRVATLDQVHGREVVTITRGTSPPPQRPKADALVSDDPAVAVAVRAADCVPLLLADASRGAVAAVHAGWRGTAAGVVPAAVDALRRLGVNPARLVAAIGPSVGACCYEVGSELIDAFTAAGYARTLLDRWFVSPDPEDGIRDPGPGIRRWRLDLVGATRDQLVLAGVREAQIHACGLCTAMHLDVLTSYRAEKEKAGRIAAAIRCRA
jgi:YfiH family protein